MGEREETAGGGDGSGLWICPPVADRTHSFRAGVPRMTYVFAKCSSGPQHAMKAGGDVPRYSTLYAMSRSPRNAFCTRLSRPPAGDCVLDQARLSGGRWRPDKPAAGHTATQDQ